VKKVETSMLLEELETDGHSPMKFLCSDNNIYYVKYRSGKSFDKNEIHCLVFEMICTRLLQSLSLPVPQQALILIKEDSITPSLLKVNKRYIREGVIAWGSLEVPGADLFREIELIRNKREFNKLLNPEDLVRIAIFDLWVDNTDRYSENYNLLVRLTEGKLEIIPIDHAFTFGGLKGMKIFNENTSPDLSKKLIISRYFCKLISNIKKRRRLEIANEFLSLISQLDVEKISDEVFEKIPQEWNVNTTLKSRMIRFLKSNLRQKVVQQLSYQQLQKNFTTKR
jgi:hypothetical protein